MGKLVKDCWEHDHTQRPSFVEIEQRLMRAQGGQDAEEVVGLLELLDAAGIKSPKVRNLALKECQRQGAQSVEELTKLAEMPDAGPTAFIKQLGTLNAVQQQKLQEALLPAPARAMRCMAQCLLPCLKEAKPVLKAGVDVSKPIGEMRRNLTGKADQAGEDEKSEDENDEVGGCSK